MLDFRINGRKLKLAILSEEFFEPDIRGIGGFGFAVKQVCTCFNNAPELGVEITLIMSNKVVTEKKLPEKLHGSRILWRTGSLINYAKQVQKEKFDLLLCIDNLKIYQLILWSLPLTPCIFWIRDPRPPEDNRLISSLRYPGEDSKNIIEGLHIRDMRIFKFPYFLFKLMGRSIHFATPTQLTFSKFEKTYGFKPKQVTYLPNILDIHPVSTKKTDKPTVIMISRLDPIKRPWLGAALAEQFPDVDFLFLGKQFIGDDKCLPNKLPLNFKMLGFVDGQKKIDLLASSWVILNTSIHESLAMSFQEALICETPILSCVNPDGLSERFGVFVGEGGGSGMQLLPKFEAGLKTLLTNPELRQRLGREGREWAIKTTHINNFLNIFYGLCQQALASKK